MHYDINWLLNRQQSEKSVKYLFFWGHQPERDGSIGRGCLSQWSPAEFTVDGQRYATAEHWMMAGKARLFGDDEMLEKILHATSPAEAKKLGRKIRNFDQDVWMKHAYDVVKTGNLHKFGQNDNLKTFLLATGERVLVEASPLDRIWGIGLAKDHPDVENPEAWRGLNLLGFALMEVRDQLRQG